MAEIGVKRMSVDEFLTWEARQERRYELVDGVPRMMTGGTRNHDDVRLAVAAELRRLLRGRPCRAQLDMKVVCETGNVRYPDAQVDCGPTRGSDQVTAGPTVVVEVLSPSSRTIDFIAKLRDYNSVRSISTYLVFDQTRPQVTVFRRTNVDLAPAEVLEDRTGIVELPDVGIALALADVYPDDLQPADPALSADGG